MSRSRQWTFGAVAIIVVIAVAGWFLLVQSQRKQAADLNQQTQQQLQTNQGLQVQIAALKAQSKKLPQMQAQLAEMHTKIPVASDEPQFIRQLSDAAKSAGVTLATVAVADPVSETPTTNASGGVVLPPGQLAIVGLTLEVHGNYFEIEEFMNNLEKMPRAVLVSGLSITAATDTGTSGLVANVTARVFFAPQDLPVTTAIPGLETTPVPATSAPTSSTAQ
jgi:Tfp pilus assembly protein PilO